MLGTACAALVGRSAELARLTDLLAQASAGRPVVVLVSGDAGVGKTRLVAELAAVAAGQRATVLSGRCAELAGAVPYLPLADALRDAAAAAPPDGPLCDALAARPVLSRLLPDRADARSADGDVPGLAQQQLFGAVLGMLAELAETGPVLLILEDLHWADRSTRDLVTFLSRVFHSERIAVVATYRSDDMHRRHPLRPVIAELLRLPGVSAVELGPLDAAAMAEHLTALAPRPLDAAELGRIISRAEGNAYYGEELLAAALAASAAGSQLPAGLADLLLARFERLSPSAQQVVRAAAVAGRRVEDELVMQASGLGQRDYEQAVREAVAHQLLVPDGPLGYAFRHALLREAIYADLLPGERTRLHARLAELLSDERRLADVPGTAAELAHHCLASHDVHGAFAASVLAGQEAARLAAPAEAHRHYDQALALWDRVSEPAKVAGAERGMLAFRSALNAADGGDVGRAVAALRRLLGYLGAGAGHHGAGHHGAGRDGDDPALRCRVSERLAYLLLDTDDDEAALAAAAAAVAALPAAPPCWERARAQATYARALLTLPDSGEARASARQALEAARAAGAPWVEADALVTLGAISAETGQVADAVGQLTAAYRQAAEAGITGVQLRAAYNLARVQLELGDLAEAARVAHEGTRCAQAAGLGMAPYGVDLRYLHYLVHFSDGEWQHARKVAEGFAVLVANVAEARLSAAALFLAVATGSAEVAERRTWLEPFIATDQQTEYLTRSLLAEQALWQGDPQAALAQVQATIRALAAGWGGEYRSPQVIRAAAVGLSALADQAAAIRAGGRAGAAAQAAARGAGRAGDAPGAAAVAERAGELIEAAREGAAHRRRPGFALGVEGRGWLARAEAEWRRARGANDPGAWRAVVDAFGPGFVYETARSRWRLAEALAEAGDRAAAQREWQLAAAAAQRLGALPLQAALADLGRRARLGGRGRPGADAVPGTADARRASALAALTGREREVLALLAAGQSNKEIAVRLFIAPKTASVHVSNILAKLGAGSRAQAAAIAYQEGLDGP